MTLRALVLCGLATSLMAQIRGPMLGFVWDARLESIRPVLGIAGSSVLGASIALDFPVKRAVISPNQDFALAAGGDERRIRLVDLRPAAPVARAVDGLPDNADRIHLSPRGNAAAVVYTEAKKVIVLTGLPDQTTVQREIDLSVEEIPPVLALSDGGGLLLAGYPETKTVLVIDDNGNRTKYAEDLLVRAASFLEGRPDAILALEQGVRLVRDLNGSRTEQMIYEAGPVVAVASLSEGRRALLVDDPAAKIVEVDLNGGASRSVDCPCIPTVVSRMTTGIFRLNEVSRSPLWLLEVQESGIRTLFVPPDPSDAETPARSGYTSQE